MVKMSKKAKLKEIVGNSFLTSDIFPNKIRVALMRSLGISIGKNVVIKKLGHIDGFNISIGESSLINREVLIHTNGNEDTKIVIGKGVQIAPRVNLLCTTHDIGESNRRASTIRWGNISIKDGAWIGVGATILPGVTIDKGCIVAAGAVVTKDTEPNGLYTGVPARRIKELD